MRLISIEEYSSKTMQLARPVIDKQRRVLLASGRIIHPEYLKRIKEMGIKYLFVEDAVSYGITLEEMMDMPTWIEAIEVVQTAFTALKEKKEFPIRSLQKLIVSLMNEVVNRKVLVLIPTSSIAAELQEAAHAINVTLLSLQLGKKLHIPQLQMKDLGMGSLLHDAGKILSSVIEDHPKEGFEYIRKIREISLISAHIAFQHHEHVDGKGYPRGMEGSDILEFAQICSICNCYENLTSIKKLPPHEAMEWIMTKSGTMFNAELVMHFVQEIPPYIPGTTVILNNGRKAVITKIIANLQRPYIRYIDTNEEISLADHHTLLISQLIHDVPEEA